MRCALAVSLVLFGVVLGGCGASTHPIPDASEPFDASADDAANVDAAEVDASAVDAAEAPDASVVDAAVVDAATADAAITDARPDATIADARPDASVPDASTTPDAGVTGTWTALTSGTTSRLNGVWGTPDGSDIWAVGSAVILHSTDHGAHWTSEYTGSDYFVGVWGSSATDVYAVSYNQLVHYDGKSWTPQTIAITAGSMYTAWGRPGEMFVFAGASSVYVMRTTGNGTWAQQGTVYVDPPALGPRIRGWGDSGQILYFAYDGEVGRSGDDGVDWTVQMMDGNFGEAFNSGIWGASTTDLYVCSDTGMVAHTDDDGLSWTVQSTPTSLELDALWGVGSDVWAVGQGITIVHTADHGAHWNAEKLGMSSQILHDVWGVSAGEVYAVGDNGIIVRRH